MELQGDTGARELLRNARTVTAEALSLDIDTEEDVRRAQELFG
jgi:CTP:molybdopterin cytidylyltransferase MocA